MSIELVMSFNHLILCSPPFLPPSIFPSIMIFLNESVLYIRWLKYWSFSFSISASNEYSGWISIRMDWFDLLSVQGILKSLLQHHSSKAWIFQGTAFFILQLSHPYTTTGKTISSVHFNRSVRLFVTPWIIACQASPSITNSWSSPKLMSIESVMYFFSIMEPTKILYPWDFPDKNTGMGCHSLL